MKTTKQNPRSNSISRSADGSKRNKNNAGRSKPVSRSKSGRVSDKKRDN